MCMSVMLDAKLTSDMVSLLYREVYEIMLYTVLFTFICLCVHRKRKTSTSSSSHLPGPTRRKRKAAAVDPDGNRSGSSDEDSATPTTSDRLVGRGMFSQYFNQPSSSASSAVAR